ncbi:hypothetical protein BKA93DRAFT_823261 [Sparassis latifolia]|uniref:Homeobox domain-containing protein n=1 Tax=Sparassis crispa TaxID=139825 RepID=A0A401H1X9_9APHY|nr:hypothetical protein SCP_1302710 [Sparassis crispa]GBE88456.1 hypothetical protein SCP_1302710 [Sparassis crispa]
MGSSSKQVTNSLAGDDDLLPESSASSPSSVSGFLRGASEDTAISTDTASPSLSIDNPSSASTHSKSFAAKGKRKRSRVTPEQLSHLERFFASDRSPTAARRKEISGLLGMHERQTQIWFQNRRAKAKLQDVKIKGRAGLSDPPPDTPPELCSGFDIDLYNLIHEDEPVTIIPCTDLSIGTWRRVASTVSKHDLVGYVCQAKRCITWFIYSSGLGFKIEISFDIVVDTEFTNVSPGVALAALKLSQPPAFYLEHSASSGVNSSSVRYWKRCADWTEGMQATRVLRHEVIGSEMQLSHIIRNFSPNGTVAEVSLYSLPQRAEASPVLHPTSSLPLAHEDHCRDDMSQYDAQYPNGSRQRLLAAGPSHPLQNFITAPAGCSPPYPADLPYPHVVRTFPPMHLPSSYNMCDGDRKPPHYALQFEPHLGFPRRMSSFPHSHAPIPQYPSACTNDSSPRSVSPYECPNDLVSSASTSHSSFDAPS